MAALPAIIAGAGSLFGGLFGGMQSSHASKQYIQALEQAQKFMEGQEQLGLGNYQPYLNAGSTAAYTLGDLMSTPGKGLLSNWTGKFTAPTAAQAAATPGYQFQLQQGENAIQNSAAGKGSLLSGRTLADLNNYAQGVASTNYQNVFNNALTQYNSAYQTFLNNQNNQYSRLMGVSGQGLTAAEGAGSLISGIGGDIASLYAQKGAAQAGGTIGAANAYSSILPGIASAINSGYTLSNLFNPPPEDWAPQLVNNGYIPGGGFDPSVYNSNNPTLGLNPPALAGIYP